MRALVTGITGFAGSHLADYLLAHTELEVFGVDLRGFPESAPRSDRLHLCQGDLGDPDFVLSSLEEAQPRYLFHLAAQAFVPLSWEDPWGTLANNIRGQLNLFQGLLRLGLLPRILVVGSGDEYGLVRSEELPIGEDTPLRPYNPYAVSKVVQDMLGYQYFASHGLHVVRVRPFNHIGPRQSAGFVTAAFAKQIAEAEAGRSPPVIKVGNLEAKRDFTDVRDMVAAYYLALSKGEPGEVYNIGFGTARSIGEILDILLAESKIELTVQEDPTRLRLSEVPIVACDSRKFRECTGWEARIPLEESLHDILDYWREEVEKEEKW
ncbi:MAG: GDP-mannose 4,6-dehydratase [Gammaproteobacteria bacterium]|nr:GDP-mannose 4,6-dehydratase [Gammaproteobacteria bacterium]